MINWWIFWLHVINVIQRVHIVNVHGYMHCMSSLHRGVRVDLLFAHTRLRTHAAKATATLHALNCIPGIRRIFAATCTALLIEQPFTIKITVATDDSVQILTKISYKHAATTWLVWTAHILYSTSSSIEQTAHYKWIRMKIFIGEMCAVPKSTAHPLIFGACFHAIYWTMPSLP